MQWGDWVSRTFLCGVLDRQRSYNALSELKVLKRGIVFADEKSLCLIVRRRAM